MKIFEKMTEKRFIDKWVHHNTCYGPLSALPRTQEEWELKAKNFIRESKLLLEIMGIDRPDYLSIDSAEKMAAEALSHIEDMINFPGDRG